MKTNTKKWRLIASCISGLGILINPINVFAANPYNMSYTGGEILGVENVNINENIVSELTPLAVMDDETTIDFSESDRWEEGYLNNAEVGCTKVKYFRVSGDGYDGSDDLSFRMNTGKYTADVDFSNIALENNSDDGADNAFAVGVLLVRGYVFYGFNIYSDDSCQTSAGLKSAVVPGEYNAFVRTNIKLYENDEPFLSNKTYFGVTDIDAAQSYKIMNDGNEFSHDNMYALSADGLQPTSGDLKNMFSENGHYIYSQYDAEAERKYFDIQNGTNDVYVSINAQTQEEGLDMVFGFTKLAWSGIQYYAKQYSVEYKSDKNGEIKGVEQEAVISGAQPSGSESKASDGYVFEYWVADKDVILTDGTEIKAGEEMTMAMIKQVVVNEDLVFTAIHVAEEKEEEEEAIAVPDTGANTQEMNALQNTTPIIAIIVGILGIGIISYLINRKKVSFN